MYFSKILVHNHVTWNCFRPILTYSSRWRNLLAAWNFTFRCFGDTKICRRDLKRHFIYHSIQKINLAASHRILLGPQIVECQNKISSCLRDALGWFISGHSSKSMPIVLTELLELSPLFFVSVLLTKECQHNSFIHRIFVFRNIMNLKRFS